MILDYLNQIVSWERYTNVTTQQGDKIYDTAIAIKARKRRTAQAEVTEHGGIVNTQFVVHTVAAVEVGDLLDGLEIIKISDIVNYAGIVIGVLAFT